jgi:hypothetical protein
VHKQFVEAVLPQEDFQLLGQQADRLPTHTEVRMVGDVNKVIKAQSVVLVKVALSTPPSPALSTLGGGEGQLDPTERNAPTYVVPQFQARVVLDGTGGNGVTGQRAYVRFKLAKRSLLWQWGRRFWQLIEAKGASAKWI